MAVMNTTTGIVYLKGITGNITVVGNWQASQLYANAAGVIGWDTRSVMRSPSNGVITFLNLAENDFSRLQFGGTTSSFPALKRNSTVIEHRLADDSGYCASRASSYNSPNSNPATTGILRLSNTDSISSRNAANDADVAILQFTAGNIVQVGGSGSNGATSIGPFTSASDVATPAGGSTTANVKIGSAGVGHYIGTGAPSVSAAKGSIYVRTDATTTTTRMYINTDGGTTWTTFTTAA